MKKQSIFFKLSVVKGEELSYLRYDAAYFTQEANAPLNSVSGRKNLTQCHSVHHKSHADWPAIEYKYPRK
jgi:hypothetical protein